MGVSNGNNSLVGHWVELQGVDPFGSDLLNLSENKLGVHCSPVWCVCMCVSQQYLHVVGFSTSREVCELEHIPNLPSIW